MCGIIAWFHRWKDNQCLEKECLEPFLRAHESLKHRGPDSSGYLEYHSSTRHLVHGWVGSHRLAMIGNDEQPLRVDAEDVTWLVANCELYNYQRTLEQRQLTFSDTRILLRNLMEVFAGRNDVTSSVISVVQDIDGVFSFAFMKNDQLVIARDFWGVKPLYIGVKSDDGMVLASELKALRMLECSSVAPFKPGSVALVDLNLFSTRFMDVRMQQFIPTAYKHGIQLARQIQDLDEAIHSLHHLLREALEKRIRYLDSVAMLLSGGIDSSILAILLSDLSEKYEISVQGFVVGNDSSKDVIFTRMLENKLRFSVNRVVPSEKSLDDAISVVLRAIETRDLKQFTIALPLALACQAVENLGVKALITGQGADELFGGYHRYREAFLKGPHLAKEKMEQDLSRMAENNLERDDKVAMSYGLELRLPYLDLKLSAFARELPLSWKLQLSISEHGTFESLDGTISSENVRTKVILRHLARTLGLPKPIVERKKTAFQYGSDVLKMLSRVARKQGNKRLREWFDRMLLDVANY